MMRGLAFRPLRALGIAGESGSCKQAGMRQLAFDPFGHCIATLVLRSDGFEQGHEGQPLRLEIVCCGVVHQPGMFHLSRIAPGASGKDFEQGLMRFGCTDLAQKHTKGRDYRSFSAHKLIKASKKAPDKCAV